MNPFPEGFLVIGDALCTFNPIYAQGMSATAKQAKILQDILSEFAEQSRALSGIASAFFPKAGKAYRIGRVSGEYRGPVTGPGARCDASQSRPRDRWQGGRLTRRRTNWLRDTLMRMAMAPRLSRPTRWTGPYILAHSFRGLSPEHPQCFLS
jgi:2-polyprenyl-6-methoxyphenol hydroxylase-like FAD-dependent oxidoreductase